MSLSLSRSLSPSLSLSLYIYIYIHMNTHTYITRLPSAHAGQASCTPRGRARAILFTYEAGRLLITSGS